MELDKLADYIVPFIFVIIWVFGAIFKKFGGSKEGHQEELHPEKPVMHERHPQRKEIIRERKERQKDAFSGEEYTREKNSFNSAPAVVSLPLTTEYSRKAKEMEEVFIIPQNRTRKEVKKWVRRRGALRSSVVMAEVLGKPKGLE